MTISLMQRLAQVQTSRFLLKIFSVAFILLSACAGPNTPSVPVETVTTTTTAARTVTAIPTTPPTATANIVATLTTVPNTQQLIAPTPFPVTTTPVPTIAAPPTAPPPASNLAAYESTITIKAYPYEKFLVEKRDPATNVTFRALDRAAYDAAADSLQPEPKNFRALILENEFLTVTILPELGGRIYQIMHKPSGKTFLYNNAVLKPTRWGMPDQDGWLAAGGIEWAFPTQEHGYEWNAPWDAHIERDAQSVSVVLTDSHAHDRPRAQVRVTLPAHAAYLAVSPRIENPTAQPQRIQFWDNAMLNLGATGALSPQTEFIFPDKVLIHSTANDWIPQEYVPVENATAPSAPVALSNPGGRDLRFYRNWDNYLGVFAADAASTDLAQAFVGAYNYETGTGLARIFSPQLTPGAKLFAWGPNFGGTPLYTDNGAEYFEMWGGLPRTFFPDDDIILQPGETRAWSEYFLPLPDTNGIGAASKDFAMTLRANGTQVIVTAYAAAPHTGILVLKQGDREIQRWDIALDATQFFQQQLNLTERPLTLQRLDRQGNVLLQTTVQE